MSFRPLRPDWLVQVADSQVTSNVLFLTRPCSFKHDPSLLTSFKVNPIQPRPLRWVHLSIHPQPCHDVQGMNLSYVQPVVVNQCVYLAARNSNLSTATRCHTLRPNLNQFDSIHTPPSHHRVFPLPRSITAQPPNTPRIPIPRSVTVMDIPPRQQALLFPATTCHQFRLINQGCQIFPLIQRIALEHGIQRLPQLCRPPQSTLLNLLYVVQLEKKKKTDSSSVCCSRHHIFSLCPDISFFFPLFIQFRTVQDRSLVGRSPTSSYSS